MKVIKKQHDPFVYLSKVLLIAGVAIGAASFIFFIHWFAIQEATHVVIVEPTEQGVSFIQKYFPSSFFQEMLRQQTIIWKLLAQGMSEMIKSIGFK